MAEIIGPTVLNVIAIYVLIALFILSLSMGFLSWFPMAWYFFKFFGDRQSSNKEHYRYRMICFGSIFTASLAFSWLLFAVLMAH